ncbi:MAG: hypothetical protein R3F65_18040 [bacterium]
MNRLSVPCALALSSPLPSPPPSPAPRPRLRAAAQRGDDVPCQVVLPRDARAPYRGVLLSPAKFKAVQADIATLEAALTEQKALTDEAREQRDAARLEARGTITDLLQTGQRSSAPTPS